MATFTRNVQAQHEQTNEFKEGVSRVNLYDANGVVAFANINYKGKVFINSMVLRASADGETYLTFPSKQRKVKGEPVLNEDGKPVYDNFCGCATKEARKVLTDVATLAAQNALDSGEKSGVSEHEDGDINVKATARIIGDGTSESVAMVTITCSGVPMFFRELVVREKQDGNVFFSCPSRKRQKDGQDVLDEEGRPIYDNYYGTASRESYDEVLTMLVNAVQTEMDKS